MLSEFQAKLAEWSALDTWIAVTAALAAMACALPGNYLVLRRQSMMGDALSHTVLLGVVTAFLVSHRLNQANWISEESYHATKHAVMFLGAMIIGVVSALFTEWIRKLGRVEASAALGVVFTTFFALGLLLIRAAADSVHIDPDCVLYGNIETVVLDTAGRTGIPRAALVNGCVLLFNGLLVMLFHKELRISAFDPALATSQGINSSFMHYALISATAMTLVAAFESVGSILVIAMLIVPAATAYLLTDRLTTMIGLSLVIAAMSSVLGHAGAIAIPPVVLPRLGFEKMEEVSASTAGMMALASGLLFVTAMFFSPRHGILSRVYHQFVLKLKIASEDLLGLLYRLEEIQPEDDSRLTPKLLQQALGLGPLLLKLAMYRLRAAGQLVVDSGRCRLTSAGREAAKTLVRSHRLWESYMAKYFVVPDDHLHETAAKVEHYIGAKLREDLDAELDRPQRDPHGRIIPAESDGKDLP